jgi:hypothetical protein
MYAHKYSGMFLFFIKAVLRTEPEHGAGELGLTIRTAFIKSSAKVKKRFSIPKKVRIFFRESNSLTPSLCSEDSVALLYFVLFVYDD